MLNPKLIQFMVQLQSNDEELVEKTNINKSVPKFNFKKYGMFHQLKFAHITIKSE